MQIRRVTKEDFDELSQLLTQVWKSTYQGIFPQIFLDNLEDQKWLAGLTSMLHSQTECWLAEHNKKIVGMLTFGEGRKEYAEAEIYVINVLPSFQGQGIGKALIQFALAQLKGKSVYLEVVVQNHQARRFYEQHGFRDTFIVTERQMADFTFQQVVYRLT